MPNEGVSCAKSYKTLIGVNQATMFSNYVKISLKCTKNSQYWVFLISQWRRFQSGKPGWTVPGDCWWRRAPPLWRCSSRTRPDKSPSSLTCANVENGMNDRISASYENASLATLKSHRWDYIITETFLYLEKENCFMMKQFSDGIATLYEIVLAGHWV